MGASASSLRFLANRRGDDGGGDGSYRRVTDTLSSASGFGQACLAGIVGGWFTCYLKFCYLKFCFRIQLLVLWSAGILFRLRFINVLDCQGGSPQFPPVEDTFLYPIWIMTCVFSQRRTSDRRQSVREGRTAFPSM